MRILNNIDQLHRTLMKRASATIFRMSKTVIKRGMLKLPTKYYSKSPNENRKTISAQYIRVRHNSRATFPLISGTWAWGCWSLSHPWAECPARPRWSAPPAGYFHQQSQQTSQFKNEYSSRYRRDPAIFVIDLQDANKKGEKNNSFKKFFCLLLFKGTLTSFFKDKK